MAKFKGFTNQQTHQLLSELGYDGPVDKKMMDAFVAATPSAASMLGRYNEMARDRIEGRSMSMGFANGGQVKKPNMRELMEAIGGKSIEELQADGSYGDIAKQSSELLYGVVGANQDTRNWDEIMKSDDVLSAARNATGQMYTNNKPAKNITSKSTSDPALIGTTNSETGEKYEYFNVGQTFDGPTVVETSPGTFAIVDKNGQVLRGGYNSRERAEEQGVNFGVGVDRGSTSFLITTTPDTTTTTDTGTTGTGVTSELPDKITTTDDDLTPKDTSDMITDP